MAVHCFLLYSHFSLIKTGIPLKVFLTLIPIRFLKPISYTKILHDFKETNHVDVLYGRWYSCTDAFGLAMLGWPPI